MVLSKRAKQVTPDPDDNKFLECADAARADYLVTGNQRHFPKFWKKTKVITSREFISIVAIPSEPMKAPAIDDGVPFYRSSNVGKIFPKEGGLAFITPQRHAEESKTALKCGDIMLAKTGKEAASVVLREECDLSQDVVAIRRTGSGSIPLFSRSFSIRASAFCRCSGGFRDRSRPIYHCLTRGRCSLRFRRLAFNQ